MGTCARLRSSQRVVSLFIASPRRPMFQKNQWRILPDDLVQVVTGSETGATGRVLAVIKDKKQPEVIVEGVNMVRGQHALLQEPDGARMAACR